ncbi:MAG TPA: hypothetical protein VG962_08460 [Steroidobacteraceae bacterium]|nr:hypothetical protein [Steroidobacteraceae bacterium]
MKREYAPGNTQNYNRYSYVLNNPLRYTDPTGFDLEEVVVKGTRSSGGGAGFSSDDGGGGATTSGGDGDEGQQLNFMNTEKNAATNSPPLLKQDKISRQNSWKVWLFLASGNLRKAIASPLIAQASRSYVRH